MRTVVELGPLVAVITALALRRWSQTGAYPTGLDAGNWLAYGADLFDGAGKSTGGTYPPLIPALLHVLAQWSDPVTAARLVSVLSIVVVLASTYWLTRKYSGRWIALALATTVGLSGYLTETAAFGGYPQNFALAFLLPFAYFSARYLRAGARRDLLAAGGFLVLVALSHQLYFGVAAVVALVIWLIWLSLRPGWRPLIGRTAGLALVCLIGVLTFLPPFLINRGEGFSPLFNAASLNFGSVLHYPFTEAVWFWWTFIAVSTLYLALNVRRRSSVLWQTSAALVAAGLLGMALSGEPRLALALIVGATLAAAIALQAILTKSRGTIVANLAIPAAVALPLLLLPLSDTRARDLYNYYGIADRSLIETAAWVDAEHQGRTVAVARNKESWPLGWWFEGLTGAEILVGSDERWLGFPAEREAARIVNRFVDQPLTSAEVRALARQSGVELLVVKQADWPISRIWQSGEDPLPVVFTDAGGGGFTIFDLASR